MSNKTKNQNKKTKKTKFVVKKFYITSDEFMKNSENNFYLKKEGEDITDRPLYRLPIFSLHNQFIDNTKANADKCHTLKNKVITEEEEKKREFILLLDNFYNFYKGESPERTKCLNIFENHNTNTNTDTNVSVSDSVIGSPKVIKRRRSKLKKRFSGLRKSLIGEDVRDDLSINYGIIDMCKYFPVCLEFDSTGDCILGHIAKSKLDILTVVESVIEYYYSLKKEGNNLYPLILTPDFKKKRRFSYVEDVDCIKNFYKKIGETISKIEEPIKLQSVKRRVTLIGGSQISKVNKNEDITEKQLKSCMNKVITRVKNKDHIEGLNLQFLTCLTLKFLHVTQIPIEYPSNDTKTLNRMYPDNPIDNPNCHQYYSEFIIQMCNTFFNPETLKKINFSYINSKQVPFNMMAFNYKYIELLNCRKDEYEITSKSKSNETKNQSKKGINTIVEESNNLNRTVVESNKSNKTRKNSNKLRSSSSNRYN